VVVWQHVVCMLCVLFAVLSATGYFSVFRKSVDKIQVSLNLTRTIGTLHEDHFTFLIISRSILLRMRGVSDKICRENQNAHVVFNNFFV